MGTISIEVIPRQGYVVAFVVHQYGPLFSHGVSQLLVIGVTFLLHFVDINCIIAPFP